jgi:di/tricarboxylate transporter
MDGPLIITSLILIGAVALFLTDRLRADIVALLVVVALGVTGVLTVQEAFSGLSRSAVVTIMAIFILAEGLRRSGVAELVGNLLLRVAGTQEHRLVVVVMAAGAFMSLFMNNIAAASVLLPAVSSATRKANVNPSRLLMPLAFATILGGMATLLTTTNIVVSGLLRGEGLPGYGLLEFAPLGLPIVAAGVAYMVLWGRRYLPVQSPAERLQAMREVENDLVDVYRLRERLIRASVPADSSLVGKSLAESALREVYNLSVVAVENGGRVRFSPAPETVLREGDIVLLGGKLDDFYQRNLELCLDMLPPRDWREQDFESPTIAVVEAVLAPRSGLIGQTLRGAHFREKYSMTALAAWRAGRPIRSGLTDLELQFGDALLLMGPRERLAALRTEPDFILLGNGREETPAPPGRHWLVALAIMGVTLLLASFNDQAVGEWMLGGALAMILAGVLTADQAYSAIEWKSVFLVAGMLPMGIAMTKTGAAALSANGLITYLGPAGPLALLVGLVGLAVLLTQVMNGAAVATVVTPIAIQTAQHVGADPRALAMGVALATSIAFLTPLGHPVNVLVMGPGGYRFRDYFKVGLPLTLLLLVVIITLLPVFWPLVAPG